MAFEYRYGNYNPGQYPAEVQGDLDAAVADGWQVNTATLNYSEIYILWQRELPEDKPDEPVARHRAPDGTFAKDTSGSA